MADVECRLQFFAHIYQVSSRVYSIPTTVLQSSVFQGVLWSVLTSPGACGVGSGLKSLRLCTAGIAGVTGLFRLYVSYKVGDELPIIS